MTGGVVPGAVRSTRVLGTDGRFRPAVVHLDDAFIGRVEPFDAAVDADTAGAPGPPDVLDVGDAPVTPAFVNAHTHVALGFLRGRDLAAASAGNLVEDLFFRIERSLAAEDVRAFARMGAYECLLQGVGLVWDHYYFADAVVEALLDAGLTAVMAPTLQDVSGPGTGQLDDQLEATERIAGDEALARRGVFAALGAHATDTVSADLWRRVGEHAERWKVPVHAHVAQSAEECLRALERHGSTPLAWLRDLGVLDRAPRSLLVHCLYAQRSDLEALAVERVALGFCPYAQRVFGFPADPRRWTDAGVPWFVATDTSAGNDSMNLQKELRAVAELRTTPTAFSRRLGLFLDDAMGPGAPDRRHALQDLLEQRDATFTQAAELAGPEALLRRVWDIPGSLHPSFRAGVIAPGCLANLLVWDTGHPAMWPAADDRAILQAIAMGDTTGAIATAVVAGRVVGEPGDFASSVLRSAGYRQAREEADARLHGLAAAL